MLMSNTMVVGTLTSYKQASVGVANHKIVISHVLQEEINYKRTDEIVMNSDTK